MGFWGDLLEGVSEGVKQPEYLFPLIRTGATLIGGLTAPDPQVDYRTTEAASNAQLAFEREKLAQALEIAKLNAASAGAGSGAAIQAAKIGAAARLAELKSKALADNLAVMLEAAKGQPELRLRAAEGEANARIRQGENVRTGFGNLAQVLQGYRAR